jgi:hypothetical protein
MKVVGTSKVSLWRHGVPGTLLVVDALEICLSFRSLRIGWHQRDFTSDARVRKITAADRVQEQSAPAPRLFWP